MVPRDGSVSKTHDMTQALCGGVKDKPKWMAIMKGSRAFEQAQTEWWNYGCVRTCVIWSTFCNPIRSLANLLWCNPSKTTLFKTFALSQTLNSQNLRSARESPKNSSPPLVSIGKRAMWTVLTSYLGVAILSESARCGFSHGKGNRPSAWGGNGLVAL